jgi:hypothetical protein
MKELLKIKSITTLIITAVFSYLSVIGKIDSNEFMLIMVMVYTYYFNKDNKEIKLPTKKETPTEKLDEIKFELKDDL